MKALSLWQPWASLIAIGAKRVETRSWRTMYRGPIAIHAAKRMKLDQQYLSLKDPFRSVLEAAGIIYASEWPLGAIVAVADLVVCCPTFLVRPHLSMQELAFGDYSEGRFAWELKNVRRLREPVLCGGAQQLWTVDPRIEARVREQLP